MPAILSLGLSHFRTPVSKGIEIMEALRGHTSGYCIPTFVVDAPGGGGKTPVMPNYLISETPRKVILRNFEGVITSYTAARALRPELPLRRLHRQEEGGEDRRGMGRRGHASSAISSPPSCCVTSVTSRSKIRGITMESKLGLNFELVNQARASAAKVADDTQRFIDQHTTVTVERAVCRLLGIDGVNDMDVPLPNVVVDHLMANVPAARRRRRGPSATPWWRPVRIPRAWRRPSTGGELDLSKLPAHSDAEIRAAITPVVNATMERINKNVRQAQRVPQGVRRQGRPVPVHHRGHR